MQFRTEITLPVSSLQITYLDGILTTGSCFAEHISSYFKKFRFTSNGNPFGVLYNPASINQLFQSLKQKSKLSRNDLVFHNGEWHSFLFDSYFSDVEASNCLCKMNNAVKETQLFLEKARVVIITYGTSFIYTYKHTGQIVSNCHKLPASEFDYSRLSVHEAKQQIESTLDLIHTVNPDIQVIFTVSPVRHWKNGAIDNQLSKATLLLAIADVLTSAKKHFYFPSYELLMDDLRDYRFYEGDLLHPNQQAVHYILEKFNKTFIADSARKTMNEIKKIVLARQHRPRNRRTASYAEFLNKQLADINRLEAKYPFLDLFEDREYFSRQLREAVKSV
jgi:hypothetical protein